MWWTGRAVFRRHPEVLGTRQANGTSLRLLLISFYLKVPDSGPGRYQRAETMGALHRTPSRLGVKADAP